MFSQLHHRGRIGVLAFILTSTLCFAQFSGSIDGTVIDPSKATVSNAVVKLVNLATNVSQQAKSDNAGNYRFVSLAPGAYKLAVNASGFGASEVSVNLTTGQDLSVPLLLSVAGTS